MKYQIPKGTFDILPTEAKEQNKWKESSRWHYLEETMRQLALDYGFREIRTPIFEQTDLFIRGVGETSDIVSKEMYTFKDKGDRSMSLRPEGTASVIRSFVENGLQQFGSNQKFFYIGPFFRYDRPQAGRYRQFHQFGVEAIGQGSPEQDLEVIDMLFELYRRLGLKNLKVMLNSLGGLGTRQIYKEKLLDFLRPHFTSLSPESQIRFEKNPLRILDSKDPKEQALLKGAPTILDELDPDSRTHFEELCDLLKMQEIPFEIEPKLVRGLDYYNRTVFEITSDVLGAQNTIGAGGRYDGLSALLGGPDLPSIGFSTGMERILQTMDGQSAPFPPPPAPYICLIPLSDEAKTACIQTLYALRHNKVAAELLTTKKIQKTLQTASDLGAQFSIILGDDELEKGLVQVKNMTTRDSTQIRWEELISFLLNHRNNS
ncbi:MAG: histidine--tRNA ligase [Simkania sp.]|nr:histidine--tRNA ligase [Simkania sp.]MCB1074956.1 histidine--tRNA ligase [Simkania sp.]MCP5489753.1 histidine--tRNA ligase [Chlamydiales bacterium]